MGRIAVGEAIGAGFRLIGRQPLLFLAWCAIYFAVTIVPTLFGWSDTAAYYGRLGAGTPVTAPSLQRAFGAWEWLSFAVSLVVMVCLPTAVMRAVLHPEERQFFYLRLGARELWFALALLVLTLLWVAGYAALMLTLGIVSIVGGLAGTGGVLMVGVIAILLIPATIVLSVWIWTRLSMAATMTFAENRLRVFASWRFTKGHAWRIFLVALGLFVLTMIVLVVIFGGALAALAGAAGAGGFTAPGFFTQVSQAPLPILLAYSATMSLLLVGMTVLGSASWAEMYRQLRPQLADTFA
ncbi:MAG: hypothetical protein JNL41_14395 [Phenylobacterium sp.]|uniref:hypothetical protein n=1 Tax=Phenylobacterium sp. TaxID=1871053 RepID=UPI001A3BBC8D|nr:hypothetical protein [Phenylobacterium sp.]MBL8555461.1 hypothetical protein [Phenylobacterium sp.]